MRRVLITGCGGIGGVNFCRALRLSGDYFIVGGDHFKYHLIFADVDVRVQTPRHDDPGFIPKICEVIKAYDIEFIHPQPTVEAYELSRNSDYISAKVYLPNAEAMARGFDKLETARALSRKGVPVPRFASLDGLEKLNSPYWVRTRRGAGGRLSLPCSSADEVLCWVELWNKRGVTVPSDWIVQEYVGGRDIAWDSLWYEGKLVTSYARERLEYPFKHLVPSGIGGTPVVAKTIHDDSINEVGVKAVLAVDERPHGFYCVDLKYEDKPYVTEVNVGKAHTTLPLWSYAMQKFLGEPSMVDIYVRLGLGEDCPDVPKFNLYPEDYYIIRHIDCGSWLWREDGWRRRIV